MTQSEFFSGIEKNLLRLTESQIPVPDFNLPAIIRGGGFRKTLRRMTKARTLQKLTEKDPSAPANIRAYDLVFGTIPGIPKQRFRIFAGYVEDPSHETYREVKFRIRKWYQESGWADACDRPYAGALVVGAAKPWVEGMCPNADDMPFAQVAFQVLSARCRDPKLGVEMATSGDREAGALIFRALGEDFESQKNRVAEYVEGLFRLPDTVREGHVFVDDVAERTRVPAADVSNIFNDLQGEGRLTIRRAKARHGISAESRASLTYVVPGPAPIWRQILSRSQGRWYTRKGFCTVVSLSTMAFLLRLALDPFKEWISNHIGGGVSVWVVAIGALLVLGGLFFVVKLLLRDD